jgi:hypothetical protein
MATCKNCLKEDVCRYNDGHNLYCKEDYECPHFKNKADVVEVKHGYWIENDYRSFDGFETVVYPNEALKCSECSHNFKKELLWRKNYCPECGAKMDGERKCEDG